MLKTCPFHKINKLLQLILVKAHTYTKRLKVLYSKSKKKVLGSNVLTLFSA